MYNCTLLLTIAACLADLVSAVPNANHAPHQPPASTRCYTRYATSPAKHRPTVWKTSYTLCTLTSTSTVLTTSTLRPESGTITITSTETISTTATTSVPAPATFLPIQDSLPGSSYSGSGGGAEPGSKKRSAVKKPSGFHPKGPKRLHPQGVTCNKYTPRCVTKSTTVTSTVLSTPPATYSTTTVITTLMNTVSTTTIYGACATNNFADAYNGNTITGGQPRDNFGTVDNTSTETAYDCCVAALQSPTGGEVWAFQGGVCQIAEYGNTCPNGQSTEAWIAITESEASAFILGNAYCGAFGAAIQQ